MDLDGPRQSPSNGRKPNGLVILLHGYGSDGNDLIGLAPIMGRDLPDVEFVSPHAPFPCEMSPAGCQWFSLGDRSVESMVAGVTMASQVLNAFIDDELNKSKN